jgi:hypothetical protein
MEIKIVSEKISLNEVRKMTRKQYGKMNPEKWRKMPFASQMGNIGSEINRVIHWDELGDNQEKENSLWRALNLIDLTIGQRRGKELFRLREVICGLFLSNNEYKVSIGQLRNYFLQFALLANK